MRLVGIVLLLEAVLGSVLRHELASSHELSVQNAHEGFVSGSGGIGSIFAGFIIGPILFFCSFVCIWYNEKKAAIDARRLKLASQICEIVDVNSQSSANFQNGKLVYANGQTRTSDMIRDRVSGVMGPDLIKINRVVEVKEWRRHTRRVDDHDETYYELQWVQSHSSDEGSRHNNPSNWFIDKEVTYNQKVFLGGYNIDKATADLCQKALPFSPNQEHVQNIVNNTGRRDRYGYLQGQYIYFSSSQSRGDEEGTLRVKFLLCPTGDISIVARSTGYTFAPFPIAEYEGTVDQKNSVPDSCLCCISRCYASMLEPLEQIHIVKEESWTMEALFQDAISNSRLFAILVRVGSYILMVASICVFFSPITTLIGYIPLVGGIISGVLFFAILLAAILICIPLFVLAVSVAWIRFHPKIGLIILGVGLVVLGIILAINYSHNNGGSTAGASHLLSLRNGSA